MATKQNDEPISIIELKRGRSLFYVVGTTPLLMNRFSEKAKQQLLSPPQKKNAAERASMAKHDPIAEYRSSVYKNRDQKRPAAIHAPSEWFKGGLANAALDIPGVSKAKIERLVQCSPQIDLFGTPFLHFGMVRNSDINRTPDVRCRAIFPEWCCAFEVSYIANLISSDNVANLLAASGEIVGVGDWRPQKGGTFGQFRLAGADDKEFHRIVKEQGAQAQINALAKPVAFDNESEELLVWFVQEMQRRELEVTQADEVPIAAE